jgi:group I intron endonuclease
MGFIYCIKNKINGKCYIGQTIHNIKLRWKQHKKKSSNCAYLRRAIEKHGSDNFEFISLLECDNSKLDELEKEYIQKYNSLVPNGYNLRDGGNSEPHHDVTKKKISETLKKRWNNLTNEEKQKQKETFMKATESSRTDPEFRKKINERISKALKARPMTQERKEQLDSILIRYPVTQYDINKNIIATYISVSETARQMNTDKHTIIKCCKKNITYNNYYFSSPKY